MSLKPGLELQLGQQLTMTPQLQQAIHLLQLSTAELRQEVREQLETNPLLEETPDTMPEDEAWSPDNEPADEAASPDDFTLDADRDSATGEATGLPPDDSAPAPEDNVAPPASLRDHLLWQLELTPFSAPDRAIATVLIEGIDARGYLEISLTDAAQAAHRLLDEQVPAGFPSEADVQTVLRRLQHFSPTGVAARSLAECLHLQLEQQEAPSTERERALALLDGGQDALAHGDRDGLRRQFALTDQQLDRAMALIRRLDPAPGETFTPAPEPEPPDVIVRRQQRRWVAELNPDTLPRIHINRYYAALAKRPGTDGDYLRARLQEARWLVRSLESRNDTLLRVARCIVSVQRDFLDYGEEAMKPLVLADIAAATGLHESTISRVTRAKSLATPRGLLELKYFFSSPVSTDDGGECSSTAIRAMIRRLVAAEDARKPLSDNKLATRLQDRGIKVARRTVAKYRESLGIASSSERRRRL